MGPLALRARKSPSAAAMARGRHNDDESSRVMSMDALTVCFSFKKVLVIGILPVRCLLAKSASAPLLSDSKRASRLRACCGRGGCGNGAAGHRSQLWAFLLREWRCSKCLREEPRASRPRSLL